MDFSFITFLVRISGLPLDLQKSEFTFSIQIEQQHQSA